MTETEENLGGLLKPEDLRKLADARNHHKPFLATGRRDRLSGYFAIDDFAELVNQTGVWTPDRLEAIIDTK